MRRGLSAEMTLPKEGEPTKLSGKPKFGWLNRLKNSVRNWMVVASLIMVFLTSEKLTFLKLGPSRMLRPELPKLPNGGMAKAAVLNHRSGVGLSNLARPT